jgi:hypothetical protein
VRAAHAELVISAIALSRTALLAANPQWFHEGRTMGRDPASEWGARGDTPRRGVLQKTQTS